MQPSLKSTGRGGSSSSYDQPPPPPLTRKLSGSSNVNRQGTRNLNLNDAPPGSRGPSDEGPELYAGYRGAQGPTPVQRKTQVVADYKHRGDDEGSDYDDDAFRKQVRGLRVSLWNRSFECWTLQTSSSEERACRQAAEMSAREADALPAPIVKR